VLRLSFASKSLEEETGILLPAMDMPFHSPRCAGRQRLLPRAERPDTLSVERRRWCLPFSPSRSRHSSSGWRWPGGASACGRRSGPRRCRG